jgi:molecular chaperone DnaK (HSP70)
MYIGIDLGTTNCSVAWSSDGGLVQDLKIHQVVGEGLFEEREHLPSYCYIPHSQEMEHIRDWPHVQQFGAVVGEFARRQSSSNASRVVQSAKSWISLSNENCENRILPIGKQGLFPEDSKISPVEASSRYLTHIKNCLPEGNKDSKVVVTVPASFDQVARKMTLKSIKLAGFSDCVLLEEPQAAFYNWLYYQKNEDKVPKGTVLVIDIGGGTTDFSLLQNHKSSWKRTAVGNHLLLGGDNIDLALAISKESKLKRKFKADELYQAVGICRDAKELFLSGREESYSVRMRGSGSSLFSSDIELNFTKKEIESFVLDGFFPVISDFNRVVDKESAGVGLQEFGLPYEKDPEITEHLRQFLKKHCVDGPEAVLFHGGSLHSSLLRERLLDCMNQWFEHDIRVLKNPSPRLGVSHGACIYSIARDGKYQLIQSGLARSYCVAVEQKKSEPIWICVAEAGQQENDKRVINQQFQLKGNQQVSFPFAVVEGTDEESHPDIGDVYQSDVKKLSPLIATLKASDNFFPVQVTSEMLPTGELKLDLQNVREPSESFSLELQTRAESQQISQMQKAPIEAEKLIRDLFGKGLVGKTDKKPKGLLKQIEKLYQNKRNEWGVDFCRFLAKVLVERIKSRRKSEAHEKLWMNGLGFLLRPGFGHVLDEQLMSQMDYNFTMFPTSVQNRVEYWVMLRRISGGITEDLQNSLYQSYHGYIFDKKAAVKLPGGAPSVKEKQEMLCCFACFEFLKSEYKIQLFQSLLKKFQNYRLEQSDWWLFSKILHRKPAYAGSAMCLAPEYGNKFFKKVLEGGKKYHCPEMKNVLTTLLKSNTVRVHAFDDDLCAQLSKAFDLHIEEEQQKSVEEKYSFGDSLPLGLKLLDA